jgi:hypothetical protein
MAKSKARSVFTGTWHIVSMSAWDDDYVNEVVQAFIKFERSEFGSFQFGYVVGSTDPRETTRDGKPAVEFSWEGGDESDGSPFSGRGWAVLEGEELKGMIFIHGGDDSEFVAKRAVAARGGKD